jgi:hypothetical protein
VDYHINIDIHTAINHNKVLLVLSTYATPFSCVDHRQALKYMTLKPKFIYIYIYIYVAVTALISCDAACFACETLALSLAPLGLI